MGQKTKGNLMNKHRYTALILGTSVAVAASAFAGVALAGPGCDKGGEKAGRGAHFDPIDSNKDGKLSLAELTALRLSWLAKVDANKDGVATRAELDASRDAARKEHQQARFARDDANKDGRLTRDETRMPSAWFESADANKDGALTLAELTQARERAHADKRAGKTAKHAARKSKGKGKSRGLFFDQNGDGKVDSEELRQSAAHQFAKLDQNKDGSLTRDEFRPHRGHGKRHRRGAGARHHDGAPPAPAPIPAPVRS